MATATTTKAAKANKLEELAESNGSRLAAIATPVARFAGIHLTHVAAFLLVVQARDLIALPLAARLEAALTAGGVPVLDVIVHTWAVTFDATWSWVLTLATTGAVL